MRKVWSVSRAHSTSRTGASGRSVRYTARASPGLPPAGHEPRVGPGRERGLVELGDASGPSRGRGSSPRRSSRSAGRPRPRAPAPTARVGRPGGPGRRPPAGAGGPGRTGSTRPAAAARPSSSATGSVAQPSRPRPARRPPRPGTSGRPRSRPPAACTCAPAPLCRMARWNRPAGRRDARAAWPTLIAPADSPKIVTRSGSPPNAATLSRTHSSAATWSRMPALPEPSNPSAMPSRCRNPSTPRR